MPTLADLLDTYCVIAAGEFTRDGGVGDMGGNMEMGDRLAATTAQFCATVTMLFDTLAASFSELSGMNWTPQHGWMYAGGDYTVAIGGTRGVFAETDSTDFNELYRLLVEIQ
jgi:roadblock/LC7 domain-containing protein